MHAQIPESFAHVLRKQGVVPDTILYAIRGDMLPDESLCEVLLAMDAQTIYTVAGTQTVTRVKGARRLDGSFTLREYSAVPLREFSKIRVERRVATSLLVGDKIPAAASAEATASATAAATASATADAKDAGDDANTGEPVLLAVFSIGYTKRMEDFARACNDLLAGETPRTPHHMPRSCPKCGAPYPEEGRAVCPQCQNRLSITGRLLGFFRDYKKSVAAIVAVMFVSTAVNLLTPYISTKFFFDEVLGEGGSYYGMVLQIVLVVFAVRACGVLTNITYTYVLGSIMPWIVYDLKVKIFTAMQRLSTGYYTSKQTGELMTRVNRDANNIYWFFVDGMPYVVVNGALFIGVAVLLLSMNRTLGLIALLAIPLVILVFRAMWSVFRSLHHRIWVHDSKLTSLVSDTLSGQRVIKAFAKEEEELDRFDGQSRSLAGAEIRLTNTEFTTFPLVYLMMFFAQVIIIAVGGIMVINGEISLGTLIAFITYMGVLYGPLEFMSWVSNWWSRCVDSAQRVFEIIDAVPDIRESETPVEKTEIDGSITFDSVVFEYEAARPVIRGMTFNVEAGQMLGIVGKAGAGKSTMANLMARLYDPTEGTVAIDGVDIRQLPMELVRKNIGIVSQEIYLFIGSIADNIRYAVPEAGIEDVIAAAKAAGAHDFIMRLPDGYETRVGAGGQDLSGGERQRLSIARVIIQNPKILILDEATAAMDTETERKIQDSVNALKSGRTTIAIAHRLSTLRDADYIAVILDGRVAEYGRHQELIRKKGEFYKLYTIQTEALKYTGIGM